MFPGLFSGLIMMTRNALFTALMTGAFLLVPAAAQAQVTLDIGGFFKGYVTAHEQDEAPGQDARTFDMLRETRIFLSGKTTLDSGLTVGVYIEADADGIDSFDVGESQLYFSGGWGKFIYGAEDGVAQLLQVAAPSADSNIDGLRQTINPVNYTVAPAAFNTLSAPFEYAHRTAVKRDKLTYITPKWSGLQFGVSYTPDVSGYAASFGVDTDGQAGVLGDGYEAAARYEVKFDEMRLTLGGGYSHIDLEAAQAGRDDAKIWNLGGVLGYGPFNVGTAYLKHNNRNGDRDLDQRTWVVGADYTRGPFVIGASHFRQDRDVAAGADLETKRYSIGAIYTYGPGMTFRGSLHHIDHERGTAGMDATSYLFGTQINF